MLPIIPLFSIIVCFGVPKAVYAQDTNLKDVSANTRNSESPSERVTEGARRGAIHTIVNPEISTLNAINNDTGATDIGKNTRVLPEMLNSNVSIASGTALDSRECVRAIDARPGETMTVMKDSIGPTFLVIGVTDDNGTFAGNTQGKNKNNSLYVTKVGDGTQALGGTNTYSGPTEINAGVLAQGAEKSLSPNSNVSIASEGTLDAAGFNGTIGALVGDTGSIVTNSVWPTMLLIGATGNNGNFAGNIRDGTGSLYIAKIGDGIQTFSGSNTYSGFTLIAKGVLAQGAENSFSPNSNVFIESEGTLDAGGFNGTIGALEGNTGSVVTNSGGAATLNIDVMGDSSDFAGNIQDGKGPLSITKIGNGTQILSGNNTYTGNTVIESGQLEVNGALASPSVLVQPYGILSGIGSLAGDIRNSGKVSPGNSIGTLRVNGNYTQNGDGVLFTELSNGSSDLLMVDGSANLDGTLEVDTLSDLTEENYTILTATNGVNGTFNRVFTSKDLLLGVIYDPTNVWIAVLGKGGKMTSLEKLTPRMVANIKDILFNASNTQYGQLTARLAAIRSGVNNVTLQGLSQEPMPERYNKRTLCHGRRKVICSKEELNWDIWASASGIFSCMNNVNDLPKINSVTGYFSLGADYRISQVLNVGIYAGYQGSLSRYSNAKLRSNGLKYGLYGTSQWKGFYVNAIMGGGVNSFNLRNSADFANRRWNTRGNLFAGELNSLLGTGYEYRLNSWTFGINNSIQYTYLGISPFTQTGAETKGTDLNLRVGGQNPNSLKYTLGGNISYLWKIAPNYHILPTLGMYWQHEFLDHGQSISSQFANGMGVPFYFNSRSAERNNAFGTAGITAQIGRRLGAFAYYTPQFGGSQFYSNAIVVGANLNF